MASGITLVRGVNRPLRGKSHGMTDNDHDAVLLGGPRDQATVTAGGSALIELAIDGLIHRYIRTTKHRDDGLAIYNYDGEVAPGGAEFGTENSAERVASPLAAGRATRPRGSDVEGTSATGMS